MRPGTIIKLADGRVGTVVYQGLDGVGIKWGRHAVTLNEIMGHGCAAIGVDDGDVPDDYEWSPDAMLRESYPSCADGVECVGEEFEVEDADVE